MFILLMLDEKVVLMGFRFHSWLYWRSCSLWCPLLVWILYRANPTAHLYGFNFLHQGFIILIKKDPLKPCDSWTISCTPSACISSILSVNMIFIWMMESQISMGLLYAYLLRWDISCNSILKTFARSLAAFMKSGNNTDNGHHSHRSCFSPSDAELDFWLKFLLSDFGSKTLIFSLIVALLCFCNQSVVLVRITDFYLYGCFLVDLDQNQLYYHIWQKLPGYSKSTRKLPGYHFCQINHLTSFW